jgi:hypothetical protein
VNETLVQVFATYNTPKGLYGIGEINFQEIVEDPSYIRYLKSFERQVPFDEPLEGCTLNKAIALSLDDKIYQRTLYDADKETK